MVSANTQPPAVAKVELKRDFPGWRFLRSDQGRWWALRGPLPMNRINEVDTVVSNTAEELRLELARFAGRATTRPVGEFGIALPGVDHVCADDDRHGVAWTPGGAR